MSYNPLHIKDNNNAGASFNAHAIRFRAFDSNSNGFIFENSSGTILSSIRARDGLSYFSGNVGIGTTTPESTLDINGDLSLGVGDITAFVPGFDAAI